VAFRTDDCNVKWVNLLVAGSIETATCIRTWLDSQRGPVPERRQTMFAPKGAWVICLGCSASSRSLARAIADRLCQIPHQALEPDGGGVRRGPAEPREGGGVAQQIRRLGGAAERLAHALRALCDEMERALASPLRSTEAGRRR
jgi:hypothetical protein